MAGCEMAVLFCSICYSFPAFFSYRLIPSHTHTRAQYTHRGIVSMAGGPKGADDNRSQFFITLDACPELNNINTIFGKIANDTIYNVLKIGEMATGPSPRVIVALSLVIPFCWSVLVGAAL